MNKINLILLGLMIILVPYVFAEGVNVVPDEIYPGGVVNIELDFPRFIKYIAITPSDATEFDFDKVIEIKCKEIDSSDLNYCIGPQIISYEMPYLIASRVSGEYKVWASEDGVDIITSNNFTIQIPEEPNPEGIIISDIISDGYIKYAADSNYYNIIDKGIAMIFSGSLKSAEQTYNIGYIVFNTSSIANDANIEEVWLSLTQKPYDKKSLILSWLLKRPVYYPISYLQSNLIIIGSNIEYWNPDLSFEDRYNDLKNSDKLYNISEPIEFGFNVPHLISLGGDSVGDFKTKLTDDYFIVALRTDDYPVIRDYIKFYDSEIQSDFSPKLIVNYEGWEQSLDSLTGASSTGGGGSSGGGGGGGTNILRGREHNISALDVSQIFKSLSEDSEESIQLVDIIRPAEQPLAEPCIGDECEEFRWLCLLIVILFILAIIGIIWYYEAYNSKNHRKFKK